MLDHEIAECCKRLRLSRNLVEMAQSMEGSNHQEYLTTYYSPNYSIEKKSARKSWLAVLASTT